MARSLTAEAVRGLRIRAQLLAGRPAGDVVAAVTRVGALQAQAASAARLAVRARTGGLSAAHVDRACRDQRSVVRTWAMRGTLHMVPTADVRWIVDLFGPVNARAGRRRRDQLHLDAKTCERGLAAIEQVLARSEPLTRAGLVERIAAEGVRIDPKSQAPHHLMAYAANVGLICRGPDVERDEPTYVLLDSWIRDVRQHTPDDPLAELARRYLGGHGPATAADLSAWSGLSAPDCRKAFELIADEVVEVEAAGRPAKVLKGTRLDPPASCPPRLLGQFDALLLGYAARDLILDPAHSGRIRAGGGMIQPAALVGGRVAGTWRLDRNGKRNAVVIERFGALPTGGRDGLRREAADIGRFLGIGDTTLSIRD